MPSFGGYSLTSILSFFGIVLLALFIDIKAHGKDEPITAKNAFLWSLFWIALALSFCGYIYLSHGSRQGLLFLSGYLVEKSLSVDNLFVFIAIFSSFSIPDKYQHRILYYGIIGAIVMRMLFILLGTSAIAIFGDGALIVFAVFVIWTAWHMFKEVNKPSEELEDYSNHWSVKLCKKFFNVSSKLNGHNFFIREGSKLFVTPLFICLIVIEIADVLFAFDSVPAIFSILAADSPPLPLSTQTFLVYTSNIFAILGLRSMYFLLLAANKSLRYLGFSVIAILAFIGFKMLLGVILDIHISAVINLVIILSILSFGIVVSYLFPNKQSS